tara:strand:+ start:2703 stop:2951 length:249 start_codon:yes stop_codon:yes gene_type:complete
MNQFDSKPLVEKINILLEDDDNPQKIPWNKGLRIKALIISPLLMYLLGFIFVNRLDHKILFILGTIISAGLVLILIRLLWKP